jgi:hypothetical protein
MNLAELMNHLELLGNSNHQSQGAYISSSTVSLCHPTNITPSASSISDFSIWIKSFGLPLLSTITMYPKHLNSLVALLAVGCALTSASVINRDASNTSDAFHFFNECQGE